MTEEPSDRVLVIVEDDASFSRTLKRSFERRGYQVITAASRDELVELLKTHSPGYAVVDLKLSGVSGLQCVSTLHAHDPAMLIVVLTGFASIATAVEAIKLGACHYLAKPSNTDDIEAAFSKAEGNADVSVTEKYYDMVDDARIRKTKIKALLTKIDSVKELTAYKGDKNVPRLASYSPGSRL